MESGPHSPAYRDSRAVCTMWICSTVNVGHIIILNLFALYNFSDTEKVTDLMSKGKVDNTMA